MIFERVKKLGKVAISLALCLVVLSICFCGAFSVSAASFAGGSGTMEDPYLVATAEQLQGMKDNLSAHYKLANTIDLSGVKFTPIGNLEKPFTGSFTCDVGKNGRPLYAIKNFKFVLEVTPYLGEKINRWEAGLFGAINGARLSNIYVLDAYVENKNEGFARGAIKYNNYKPGMDEMGCAILVCDAVGSEITHCYTSGKVTGKSNWMAGLVGRAYECQISYCGSEADVINKRGFFGSGGLIGDCSSAVSFCFATGTVEGGGQNATTGGLIGQSCRAFYGVTDSYCTGKVSNKGYEAFSFAGFSGGNGQEHEEVVLENCYTLSTVTDANAAVYKVDGFTVHNSYISKDVKKGYQKDFDLADKSKIASSIGKRSGWEIGKDGYPVISEIKPLTKDEAKAYVPQANVGGNTNQEATQSNNGETTSQQTTSSTVSQSTTQQGGTTQNNVVGGTTTQQSAAGGTTSNTEVVSLDDFNAAVNALPSADKFTDANLKDLIAAQNIYDQLTEEQISNLDSAVRVKFIEIKNAVQETILLSLKAEAEKLPKASKLKAKDKEKVLELASLYSLLNDDAKIALDEELRTNLEECIEKVKTFAEEETSASASNLTTAELVLIIVLVVLNCLAIAFCIFNCIKSYKLIRAANNNADENDEIE